MFAVDKMYFRQDIRVLQTKLGTVNGQGPVQGEVPRFRDSGVT